MGPEICLSDKNHPLLTKKKSVAILAQAILAQAILVEVKPCRGFRLEIVSGLKAAG